VSILQQYFPHNYQIMLQMQAFKLNSFGPHSCLMKDILDLLHKGFSLIFSFLSYLIYSSNEAGVQVEADILFAIIMDIHY